MGAISLVSALAGVLVAYGAVLILLAVAAGIGSALGFETSGISDNEWRDLGVGAAVALGVVLFASYFFGGYVAGRMGRRAGLSHGLLVFVLGLVVVAAVAGITSATADGDAISRELQNQGIPTAADDWREIGLFGGIGFLAAMLVGSLLGGMKGERWHGLLVTRALDPDVRPRGEPEGDQPLRRDDSADTQAVPIVDGDDTRRDSDVDEHARPTGSVSEEHTRETVGLSEEERSAADRRRVDDERDATRISRLQ